ncbi:MAG: ATP phosphoribosyltransferase regulatory subunit, partial [Bacteroidetes bacterium]|nr:ATP phosphoribosyltransferase regulatory subunit [Bacteroidota bacterium]
DILKKPESYFKKYPSYVEIKKLKQYCKYYGVSIKFQPTLARGLSYYNGNVFEVKTNKMKETVCAGGSYMFNKVQSTGVSFGLERLSNLAKIKQDQEKYLVISLKQDKQAIQLVKKLRKENKNTTIFYGKPSKALEYANSYGYTKAVFVGEKEIKSKKFKNNKLSSRFICANNLLRRL